MLAGILPFFYSVNVVQPFSYSGFLVDLFFFLINEFLYYYYIIPKFLATDEGTCSCMLPKHLVQSMKVLIGQKEKDKCQIVHNPVIQDYTTIDTWCY